MGNVTHFLTQTVRHNGARGPASDKTVRSRFEKRALGAPWRLSFFPESFQKSLPTTLVT